MLGICTGQNNIVRALEEIACKIPNIEKYNKSFYDYVYKITIKKG